MMTTETAIADDVNVELVSHLGGEINDVAVAGNYAYVGEGQDLVVLDISDASNPIEIGRLITPSIVTGVAVAGNYAYIIEGHGGLFIVNISDPSAPTLAGHYDTDDLQIDGFNVADIAVSGNCAYLVGNGFFIVDISNPSAPTLAGGYETVVDAEDIAVAGNYAYIACHYGGLVIMDISNPSAPTLASRFYSDSGANMVTVAGNYAYIDSILSGLFIVDISDPSAPTLTATYDTVVGAEDIDVAGNYAYVIDLNGLQIVDISVPSSPTRAGRYYTDDYTYGVAVAGNYAYIAASNNGLQIVDVSNPLSSTLAGTYETVGSAYDIDVAGHYAYIIEDMIEDSSGISSGLFVVDLSDPSSPTLAGTYLTNDGFVDFASNVAVAGNYAYIAHGYSGLVIVDISDPSSPTLAARYDTDDDTSDVVVAGNYAYIAAGNNGLQIVDVSDPSSPTLKGTYDPDGSTFTDSVTVAGNYAYIADHYDGFCIVDISDPSLPILAGSNYIHDASDVAVAGNYAYLTGSGLYIVDISDPSSPTLVSSYGSGHSVAIEGNYAYVAGNGLYIVDISDPSSPIFAGSYDTAGYAYHVDVEGNYVYMADNDNGLVILRTDVQNQAPPSSIFNLQSTTGTTWINWTWTNPSDSDFNHTEIYLNGIFQTNTSAEFFNATGLQPETSYTIGTHTVDIYGNVNETWVNNTTITEKIPFDTLEISLFEGWNLISIPLTPEDNAVSSVLAPISGNYSIVWAYDKTEGGVWKMYDPGAPLFVNDLKEIKPGEGYWIMITANDTLPVNGTLQENSLQLVSGWNLIGYNSLSSKPIDTALDSINGNYSIVWAYGTAGGGVWKMYDPSAPIFVNDLKDMEPGRGYWIMAN